MFCFVAGSMTVKIKFHHSQDREIKMDVFSKVNKHIIRHKNFKIFSSL